MSVVILGAAAGATLVEPPRTGGPLVPLPGEDKTGLRQTWTGPDGTAYLLTRGQDRTERTGVRLRQGVKGLGRPPVERTAQTSPVLAGSRTVSTRTAERPVLWPLAVYQGGTSQDWYDYDAAFWATLRPDVDGIWTVTQPDGTSRSLACRYVGGGDAAITRDPGVIGWATYLIDLVAEQPYWRGDTVRREFADDPPLPFFGDAGTGGPPLNISASTTLTGATMLNPGDVEAYPVWTVHGPFTNVVVGVDGRTITVPFTVPDGQSLVIDPRPQGPRGKSAYDSTGARRTAELQAPDFAAVPPGAAVPLTLDMTGTGSIVVELTPLYERAY